MSKIFYLLVIILLTGYNLAAQNQINTDRPDQSDGTHIIEAKYLQIESGVQFSTEDKNSNSFDNVTLIRYGVTRKFEVRLMNQYTTVGGNNSLHGLQPPTISFKNQLCDQHGLLPKLSLVSYLKLPITLSPAFEGDHFGYTLSLAGRHQLSQKLKLYTNLGITQDQATTDISYLGREEINYNVTDKFSAYIEYYGSYAVHANAANGIDAGFIYALKNNLAIDLALGSSTLRLEFDRFISFGMSIRLPK